MAATTSTPAATTSTESPSAPLRTSALSPFDAIVLAGAGSRRLDGADKALVDIDGVSLLDRAVAAAAGAAQVIVVGPRRPVADASVRWCEEEPPDGGPVAAFAAGLTAASADVVVLLGVDLPFVAPAVPRLVATAAEHGGVAVLVDADGRINYLAAAWPRSAAMTALASLGPPHGQSMRRLVAGIALHRVADRGDWSLDCDTWQAVARARQRAVEQKETYVQRST